MLGEGFWLQYKHCYVKVDWFVFQQSMRGPVVLGRSETSIQEYLESIESLDANRGPESELILARQHTRTWNEELW